MLLLDDDVIWPEDRPIEVLDERVAVTAVPVIPERPSTLIEHFQVFEYTATNLSKRCQMCFAGDVTWASGAAAVYRLEEYLEVMRLHDGEFAGEDVQCSYLHHHDLDQPPRGATESNLVASASQAFVGRLHRPELRCVQSGPDRGADEGAATGSRFGQGRRIRGRTLEFSGGSELTARGDGAEELEEDAGGDDERQDRLADFGKAFPGEQRQPQRQTGLRQQTPTDAAAQCGRRSSDAAAELSAEQAAGDARKDIGPGDQAEAGDEA